MKQLLVLFLICLGLQLKAQQRISGDFSPAEDYTWIVAYKLDPGSQRYIADTAITNGAFSLDIPANAETGSYRLVYALPQEVYYFDVIYNGKENIELTFNESDGVSFLASKENKLFNEYFQESSTLEQQIANFYSEGRSDKIAYTGIIEKLDAHQKEYEAKAIGTLASDFILANRPYIPVSYETVKDYIAHKKQTYFKHLNLGNTLLQASGFTTNKLVNYVFTAVPLHAVDNGAMEKAIMGNVDEVDQKLKSVDSIYKTQLFHSLWAQASSSSYWATSDYIFTTYLKELALSTNNQDIINAIEVGNRLRIGASAPEITWKKNDAEYRLSTLSGAEIYTLVFWSSTCSHCLRELPALHDKLGENPKMRVIAVGLEDDAVNWEQESSKLPNFDHAIALGKWESDYAKLFDIHKTPTYFILDKDKRIISKPESDAEVAQFLNGLK